MKKLFFCFIAYMLFFTSCKSDNEDVLKLQINQLEGEWVYDHPEEGIWEVQNFLSSGVFYYSNKVTGNWKFHNSNNNGRYWIDEDNRVTCQYFINGVSSQIKMTILNISPYSYTAEYNDGATLGKFTYAKLLSRLEIKPGETKSPDYQTLVQTDIKGFKTHNAKVAEVDNSGNITAVSLGHTYIDIVTDEGTAVIEVIVFDRDNMFGDYSFAFGKTIPEIIGIFGDEYGFRNDNEGVAYSVDDYLTDEIYFITGLYDTSHVEFVQLILNDNISKTLIISYLNKRYTQLSDKDGVYDYLTDQSVNNNPVAIIYDSNESRLSYVLVKPDDRWTDFSYLFGQNDNTINKEMTEMGYKYVMSDYSYSKDGTDYYSINDSKDAIMVGFVYNAEKKMCEYWVYLNDDYMNSAKDIITWLKSKYVLSSTETTNRQYVFYDQSKRMRIVFDATGYVSYTDTKQTQFTPASKSIPSLNWIKSADKNATPKLNHKFYNLRIPGLINN